MTKAEMAIGRTRAGGRIEIGRIKAGGGTDKIGKGR